MGGRVAPARTVPYKETKETDILKMTSALTWSHEAAAVQAHRQIGTSQCGATALLSVSSALNLPACAGSDVATAVSTRLRAELSNAMVYLVSRSVAGCRASDIEAGASILWGNLVKSRFVRLPRDQSACAAMLLEAIRSRAAVVATLNPQVVLSRADAWHHQFVYGVDASRGLVFLTNPIEAIPIDSFIAQGSSKRELLRQGR